MSTLQLLLDQILLDIKQTLAPFEERVRELHDLEAAIELTDFSKESESKCKAIQESLEEAQKAFKKAFEDCKKETAKKYSDKLIGELKVANTEDSDTNPIYTGEIENAKGLSILHLAAGGYFQDNTSEVLSHIRPEHIKRDALGLNTNSELMDAIYERNPLVIDWHIENDPNVMYQKASGSSALHYACMVKDYDTAERLIEKVAREKGVAAVKEFVNIVNKYGCTPLYDLLCIHNADHPLDSNTMLKFLDLFVEKGVDLSKEIVGDHTGTYTIFNSMVACSNLQDLNLAAAVVKMLSSGQDIKIDLKNFSVCQFLTNQNNINKIFSLEDYDEGQKSIALNKIKDAISHFTCNLKEANEIISYCIKDYQIYSSTNQDGEITHYVEDSDGNTYDNIQVVKDKLHSLITVIDSYVSQLEGALSDDVDLAESGVEHLGIDDHPDTQVTGDHEEAKED